MTRGNRNQKLCICKCDCEKHTIIKVDPPRLVNQNKTHCGCERKYVLRKDKEFPQEYIGKKKVCVNCNQEKEYNNFYFQLKNNKENKEYYYFDTWCIDCNIKRIQNDRKENPQEIIDYNHKRYLKKRDYYLPLYAVYREVNKEKYQEWTKNWRQNNPDKVKWNCEQHRIHDVSTAEEKAMLEVFNYKCAYCGMTLKEHKSKYGQKLHNEHVDDDGHNDLRNDVPACKGCNSKKSGAKKLNEDMETWFKKQIFFTEERLQKILWWTTEGYKDYIEDKPPYKITRSKIEFDDNTYGYQFELWTVDDKRNMIECVDVKRKKKELNLSLINL